MRHQRRRQTYDEWLRKRRFMVLLYLAWAETPPALDTTTLWPRGDRSAMRRTALPVEPQINRCRHRSQRNLEIAMDTLVAFFGKSEVKDFYINRVQQHRAADELVKGVYYEKGPGGKVRACGVGCTIHGSDHSAYERELGIPRLLARLEDGIFESLPMARAMEWPEQFLSAIAVGADLSRVWPQFAVWLLADETDGVIRFARTAAQRQAIAEVAAAYRRQLAGKVIDTDAWWSLMKAASAASAADYAASAAHAAADYAADYAVRETSRIKQADKLLALLAEAPAWVHA